MSVSLVFIMESEPAAAGHGSAHSIITLSTILYRAAYMVTVKGKEATFKRGIQTNTMSFSYVLESSNITSQAKRHLS